MNYQIFTCKGLDYTYVQAGQGPPLLLIPGWACNTGLWSRNIDFLANHFSVYSLELPGTRLARFYPDDALTFASFSNVIKEFCNYKNLNQNQLVLLGSSLGGGPTLAAAMDMPDLKHLVLVDSVGIFPIRLSFLKLLHLKIVQSVLLMAAIRPVTKHFITDMPVNAPGWFVNLVVDNFMAIRANPLRSRAVVSSIALNAYTVYDLSKLPLPQNRVTFFWGKQDRIIKQKFIDYNLHKRANIEVFAQSGHMPFASEPDKFNRLLADIVNK